MQKRQTGFTLIEITIVLIIVGLLLGGVLKGQELIGQAKVKNVVNDLNGVASASYAYQDRYKALPGDDNAAQGRWALAAAQNGDHNGALDTSNANSGDETKLFWLHLRKAGLITGDPTSSNEPFNALNGTTQVFAAATGFSGVVLCTGSLPGKIAEALDNQLDDGKPGSGSLRATKNNTGTTSTDLALDAAVTAYADDGTTLYRICKQI